MRDGWVYIHPTPDGPPIETGISQVEADYLQEMARGKRVLEIGSAFGGSTVSMALTASEVWAVDPHEAIKGSYGTLTDNLRRYGVRFKVHILVHASEVILPTLIWSNHFSFDLVFIDGDHSAAAVERDALNAMKLAPLLIFHDYGSSEPEVAPVLDRIFPAESYGRDVHGYLLTIRL